MTMKMTITKIKKNQKKAVSLDDFDNDQMFSHLVNDTIWMCRYDKPNKVLVRNNVKYKSLSSFALAHHNAENPNRKTANGWVECKCGINGKIMSAKQYWKMLCEQKTQESK